MIAAYMGRPGAGKSYAVMVRILECVYNGIPVVTNLPANMSAIERWCSRKWYRRAYRPRRSLIWIPVRRWQAMSRLTRMRSAGLNPPGFRRPPGLNGQVVVHPDAAFSNAQVWRDALALSAKEGDKRGVLIAVDEFPSRIRAAAKADKVGIQECLERHRHFYATVFFLAQNHVQLDVMREIKHLVEQWCEIENMRLTLGIPIYQRSVYAHWFGPSREPITVVRGRFKKEIFDTYSSHALATEEENKDEHVEHGEEKPIQVEGTALRGFIFKLVAVLLIFGGLFYATRDFGGLVRGFMPGGVVGESGFLGDSKSEAIDASEIDLGAIPNATRVVAYDKANRRVLLKGETQFREMDRITNLCKMVKGYRGLNVQRFVVCPRGWGPGGLAAMSEPDWLAYQRAKGRDVVITRKGESDDGTEDSNDGKLRSSGVE